MKCQVRVDASWTHEAPLKDHSLTERYRSPVVWPFRQIDLTPDWHADLPDPPYPGLDEKAIAAAKPPVPRTVPEVGLDGQPSVRLHAHGQP